MINPRWLYSLALYLLLPWIPLRLLWRARKQPAYLSHWGERFGRYGVRLASPVIWIHAVSVGETRACAPLIDALQTRYPQHRILLSHMTPTGRETGRALFGERVAQVYLPYDLPGAGRRFLRHFNPECGLLMETELWPNLVAAATHARVPLALVNARLSEKSADGYARAGRLARDTLRGLPLICAQSEADAERFRQLGAPCVTVTGNMKFDVAPPAASEDQAEKLRAQWGRQRRVVVASSTREGEEALLLDALSVVPKEVLLVIVPRHPQRFDQVATLLEARNIPFSRRSNPAAVGADIRVLLGDTMGELFAYYGAAELAIVGGSLLPFGGQNRIEACEMGVPVIVGPHTYNFAQATDDAIAAGAALRVKHAGEAMTLAMTLLTDPERRTRMGAAAREFAERHRGAAERTLRVIVERGLLIS